MCSWPKDQEGFEQDSNSVEERQVNLIASKLKACV
jgi:hypothetical protein